MTDTMTAEAIHRHLDDEPTDWLARLELADLYEQAGDLACSRLQRWLARHQKAPFHLTDEAASWWQWFAVGTCFDDRRAALGDRLYGRLLPWQRSWGYGTRHAAEQALLVALQATDWPVL